MEISLSAVIEAARRRRAGITAEVAGYLVLLAVKEVAGRSCDVAADRLRLTETGELRLVAAADGTSERDIEAKLRHLLAALLALAQSAAPALASAAERAALGDLGLFQSELTAALIPINHAAARRALARLYREAHRALGAGAGARVLEDQRTTTPSPHPVSAATPLPASVALPTVPSLATASESPAERREDSAVLDIDVVVDFAGTRHSTDLHLTAPVSVGSDAGAATAEISRVAFDERPSHAEVARPSATSGDAPDVGCRSDLRQLLAGFLAHTRSDERMAADLRRMVGL